MLGFAWLTLRQAQEALKSGRLEEALRLLEQPGARSHRRTHDLLVQTGAELRRARRTPACPGRRRERLARPAPGRGAGHGRKDHGSAAADAHQPEHGRIAGLAAGGRDRSGRGRRGADAAARRPLDGIAGARRRAARLGAGPRPGRPRRPEPGGSGVQPGRPPARRQRAFLRVPGRIAAPAERLSRSARCACTRRPRPSAGAR